MLLDICPIPLRLGVGPSRGSDILRWTATDSQRMIQVEDLSTPLWAAFVITGSTGTPRATRNLQRHPGLHVTRETVAS